MKILDTLVDAVLIDVDVDNSDNSYNSYGGGDTRGHYLPNEPRKPAFAPQPCRSGGCLAPLNSAGHCTVHYASTARPSPACVFCADGVPVADLSEITAWSCGHWVRKRPQSIAESFQAMLRSAYRAGTIATADGETFESWYQREVLA